MSSSPLKIGITGGIGSGKSTVCRVFAALGVPVYDSDARAKALMESDPTLREQISTLLGEEAYAEGRLDRAYVASRVFADAGLLTELDGIVHPAVGRDFAAWAAGQTADYVLLESAILFESGFAAQVDRTVTVSAPLEERIARTVRRDGSDEAKVRARVARQWSDAQREARADYVVRNDEQCLLMEQVLRLDKLLRDASRGL